MNSFVFPTLRGLSYLFLLQFFVLAFTILYEYFSGQQCYSIYEIMPVITRSKRQLLRSSINEEYTVLVPSDNSINETSSSIYEHLSTDNVLTASIHESSVPTLSTPSTTFLCDSVIHTEQLSLSLVSVASSQDDTPAIFSKSRNFKISTFQKSGSSLCHNSSSPHFETMESDCEDHKDGPPSAYNAPDISQLFASLSAQMTYQTTCLQDKLSMDFSTVVQAHDKFKMEVRGELDELHLLIAQHNVKPDSSVTPSAPTVPMQSILATSSAPPTTLGSASNIMAPSVPVSSASSSSNSGEDVQTLMMMLFTESFSKLSSILVDKTTDSKSDWSKFSGDSKKFRAWYMTIMAQLSLPSWKDLYDSASNEIVLSTTNDTLNGKLYSKLLLSLEGQPLQDVITRAHLRADGIGLLRELSQTYRPKNVPEVIAAKTGEFWSKTKRKPSESIDAYFNHFHELLEDLSEADDKISTKSAMRHFIFTLGADFEPTQILNLFKICTGLVVYLLNGKHLIGHRCWYCVVTFTTPFIHLVSSLRMLLKI